MPKIAPTIIVISTVTIPDSVGSVYIATSFQTKTLLGFECSLTTYSIECLGVESGRQIDNLLFRDIVWLFDMSL